MNFQQEMTNQIGPNNGRIRIENEIPSEMGNFHENHFLFTADYRPDGNEIILSNIFIHNDFLMGIVGGDPEYGTVTSDVSGPIRYDPEKNTFDLNPTIVGHGGGGSTNPKTLIKILSEMAENTPAAIER